MPEIQNNPDELLNQRHIFLTAPKMTILLLTHVQKVLVQPSKIEPNTHLTKINFAPKEGKDINPSLHCEWHTCKANYVARGTL